MSAWTADAAPGGLVVVDSGGANLASVRIALQRLGVAPVFTREPDAIARAGRVLLPGVGAAGPVMARLREGGLIDALRALQVPLLGICVGMQVMFERSEEGDVECLGLLPGTVRRMAASRGVRVPHMGWNVVRAVRDSPLLDGVAGRHAYFVHGYAAPVGQDTAASVEHGGAHAALVQRGRIAGVQFHPERSSAAGARLLRNFMEWQPA